MIGVMAVTEKDTPIIQRLRTRMELGKLSKSERKTSELK